MAKSMWAIEGVTEIEFCCVCACAGLETKVENRAKIANNFIKFCISIKSYHNFCYHKLMKKPFSVVLFILLIIAIIVGFNILNSKGKPLTEAQKNQALTNILGRKPNLTDSVVKGNKTYKSKYISFLYPAQATIYTYIDPNIKNDPNVLDIFSFDISNPRLVFNYSAISYTNSVAKVSDIPDVRLRQLESNSYVQSTAFAGGVEGLGFEKTDETGTIEKTAFFLVNGRSFSFSLQGSDSKGIENLYNLILQSLKFLPVS